MGGQIHKFNSWILVKLVPFFNQESMSFTCYRKSVSDYIFALEKKTSEKMRIVETFLPWSVTLFLNVVWHSSRHSSPFRKLFKRDLVIQASFRHQVRSPDVNGPGLGTYISPIFQSDGRCVGFMGPLQEARCVPFGVATMAML